MKALVYEDVPRYDFWLKAILVGIVAITFVAGALLLLTCDIEEAWVMFGMSLFYTLLSKAIMPQRFQIFQDRLKIVLGGPFAFDISFSNIREVRRASAGKAFAYWGIRLATSTQGVVEIVIKKGLNLVISPTHPDMFLEQVNQALGAA